MKLLIAMAATLAVLPASAQAAAPAGVLVTVRQVAPDALEVSYALPASCSSMLFDQRGRDAATIRARWQAQGGCGVAGGDTLQRRGSCPALRFRVPATTDKVSGYPGSFPVGGAIYAHMSSYAVGTQCGPVRYRYASPGSIRTAHTQFELEAPADAGTPALLFPARQAFDGKDADYFDPALGPAAVAQMRSVAAGTAAYLQAAMPDTAFRRPIIAATLAHEPGGPNIGGSAGEVLLLTLFNWPDNPAPRFQRQMNKLVAHEMSHPFQLRDAVDVYPDARLIHEGGAEFLRWSVSLRQGWLTPQQAADELDDALASCMLGTGGRRWRAVPQEEIASNRYEYSCGLPAYVYALAARQGKGSPYARIEAFYGRLGKGEQPDFAQALECGKRACTPRVLPAILDGQGPMREAWAAALLASGLATPRAPSQSQLDAMMLQALTGLVKDDCGGKRSMTPTPNSVLVDSLASCQRLRADVEVLQVEGLPVFGGVLALPAVVGACRSRQAVTLGLGNGGKLDLACRSPYQVATRMLAADIGKIMEALGK